MGLTWAGRIDAALAGRDVISTLGLADRAQRMSCCNLSFLASAYRAAGDLARAIPLHEQGLSECVRVLGEDHPDTLAARGHLASAYRAAGDLGRAVPLHEQALAECVRVLGEDHCGSLRLRPSTATYTMRERRRTSD